MNLWHRLLRFFGRLGPEWYAVCRICGAKQERGKRLESGQRRFNICDSCQDKINRGESL